MRALEPDEKFSEGVNRLRIFYRVNERMGSWRERAEGGGYIFEAEVE